VTGNLFTVLLAGQDTTASTLAWTIYLISRHPAAWRQLVAEADESGARGGAAGGEPLPELPFAEACAAEAMRLHPVAPLHYFEAREDTTVGNVHVPQGTYLFCLTRLGAVDADRVDQADEYLPERWLDLERSGPLKKLSMPFGAGPRMCPGRSLAMLEMRMLLSMLARDFDLAAVTTPNGSPPRELMGFTVHPEPLRMRLSERRLASQARH
jgi:cytochrome P450